MHEILFRGKSIQGNDWVYGYFIKLLKPCIFDEKMKKDPVYAGNWIYKLSPVDPATVGQYTGLTDKNGNKIFEGDIVRYQPSRHPEKLFLVKWLENLASFRAYPIDEDAGWLPSLNTGSVASLEVVGNIYDNPEMLRNDE